MSNLLHQRLVKIRESVEAISLDNKQLRENNENLSQQIAELQKTIELQKNALYELKEENKMIKLAKEMSSANADVHDLKIKINELVRDIDKCIDLLNE
jgi:methyl-accepting chemotaxis protein